MSSDEAKVQLMMQVNIPEDLEGLRVEALLKLPEERLSYAIGNLTQVKDCNIAIHGVTDIVYGGELGQVWSVVDYIEAKVFLHIE